MCDWQDTDDHIFLNCSSPHHGLHPPPFRAGAELGYDVTNCVAYLIPRPDLDSVLSPRATVLIPRLHRASCHVSHIGFGVGMRHGKSMRFLFQMNYYIHGLHEPFIHGSQHLNTVRS